MGIIDHIGIEVADLDRSAAFYAAALKPLGITLLMQFPTENGGAVAGFGKDGKAEIWLATGGKTAPHVHIAVDADSRANVDAFYEAAIAAGGIDNGKPGIRELYHPDYYGAYVLDPDGHNIEAVCRRPV